MNPLIRHSLAQQTAGHLKECIQSRLWLDRLPGVTELALHFKVSKQTVRQALGILEAGGLIQSGGNHLPRRILPGSPAERKKKLRVGILNNIPLREDSAQAQNEFAEIQRNIEGAGHVGVLVPQSLIKLRNHPKRVLTYLESHAMDAWIVGSATRNVIEALSTFSRPVYVHGGNFPGLPIAGSGTTIEQALDQSLEYLVRAGHRRIVAITPGFWRRPVPARTSQAFMKSLAAYGIVPGPYNLPDWEETPEGLQELLESLFRTTPPTALLIAEPAHTEGVLAFLSRKKLLVPDDVSLLAMILDPSQEWYRPRFATLKWPLDQHVRHIHRWLEKIAKGEVCHHQSLFPALLDPGETLGPAASKA